MIQREDVIRRVKLASPTAFEFAIMIAMFLRLFLPGVPVTVLLDWSQTLTVSRALNSFSRSLHQRSSADKDTVSSTSLQIGLDQRQHHQGYHQQGRCIVSMHSIDCKDHIKRCELESLPSCQNTI